MTLAEVANALGTAVLHATWQGSLIGIGTMSTLELTRRSGARIRHAICVAAMSLLFVIFVATFAWHVSTPPSIIGIDATTTAPPLAVTPRIESPAIAPIDSERRSSVTPSSVSIVGCCWLIGGILMTIRLSRQMFAARRLRRSGTIPPPAVWRRTFEELERELGIGRGTEMMVSRIVDSPMVVGWFRPIVLVPVSTFTSLTPEQIRSLLIHELTHLSRGDHLLNMFLSLVEVVLFFHPVTWWISHRIRSEREDSCDDRVIEVTGSPRHLAEALLGLETLRSADSPSTTTISAHGGRLMHRIHRLFAPNLAAPRRGNWRIASTCLFASILGGACLLPSATTAHAQDRGIDRMENAESRTSPPRERRRSEAGPERDRADESIDLVRMKAEIERRMKALDERLAAMVEAGEIGEADAKARYEEGERRMWERYRAAEERIAGGGERPDSRELAKLRADIEARLEALGAELREAVAAGTISAEEAKAKYAEAEARMQRRYRMAEERMAGGGERRESPELAELKAGIEERLEGLGTELGEAVAAGKITAEEAKAKFAEAEERMWSRYRMAEQRMADQRMAEGRTAAGEGRRRSPELEELKAGIEARLEALGTELREAVATGRMSAEEAREKFEEAEKRMSERYRSAEAELRKDAKSTKGESKGRGKERKERAAPPERIQARLERLQTLFEQGKITRKQMEQRKKQLKERMKD
ncbi:MAG: M56 family metallopeptidase [Planctomycetota bacterium]|nr:M56 family metallopeptidase [Planctomycetota bacterium]